MIWINEHSGDIGRDVVYIPYHANSDRSHKDVEYGTITSVNDEYVFVRYGDNTSSQATRREDLEWA